MEIFRYDIPLSTDITLEEIDYTYFIYYHREQTV